MSEKEIIKWVKNSIYGVVTYGTYSHIFCDKEVNAIQGLLDLYKKEKEKNKELEKTILEFVNDRERILKTPVISKDKIREKIEELIDFWYNTDEGFLVVKELEYLLKELEN